MSLFPVAAENTSWSHGVIPLCLCWPIIPSLYLGCSLSFSTSIWKEKQPLLLFGSKAMMTTLPFSSHAHSSQILKLLYTLCRRMLPCAYGSLLSEMKTQKLLGLEAEMKWIRQEGRPTSKYTSPCSPCGRLQPLGSFPCCQARIAPSVGGFSSFPIKAIMQYFYVKLPDF